MSPPAKLPPTLTGGCFFRKEEDGEEASGNRDPFIVTSLTLQRQLNTKGREHITPHRAT